MAEYAAVFMLGGILYGALEVLWRGWTHWTMLICGGACFVLMYIISRAPMSLARKCILSAAAITTVEFFTGCAVNLMLGMQVWDYSAQRFDLLGQICPRFTLIWLCLSAPGMWLCAWLRRAFAAAKGGSERQKDNQ